MAAISGPIRLRRGEDLMRRRQEAVRLVRRDGGVIYEAPDARVLRKLRDMLDERGELFIYLHDYHGTVRLMVARSGEPLTFW